MESRSRFDVVTGILLATKDGASKARITRDSSLAPSLVEQCLLFLRLSDLIKKEEGSELFRPTEKGSNLISDYERIDRTMEGRLVQPLTS
jgi:predicted transcriptional regulator